MKEVYDFLKDCGMYFLATLDEGKPRVRPFGTIAIFENKLYIQTGKKKNVSKQIEKNPYVEICGFKNGEWLRLSGKLIRDDRIIAKEYVLKEYPNLKKIYNAHDNNTEVLYFEEGIATFSSFTSEDKIIKF